MTKFFIGLDLGQSQDYTALSIVERIKEDKENIYNVRHLERVRGVSYPDIVNKVVKMKQSDTLKEGGTLVIDATGCGTPVADMFEKAKLRPKAVWIHGGDRATHEGDNWRVPKRDLVGVLQVLLQSGRLKVAKKLELGPILQQEMLNFKVKIDPETAHDSYSAWREADHDDLVLSVALACWYGENGPQQIVLNFDVKPVIGRYSDYYGPYGYCHTY